MINIKEALDKYEAVNIIIQKEMNRRTFIKAIFWLAPALVICSKLIYKPKRPVARKWVVDGSYKWSADKVGYGTWDAPFKSLDYAIKQCCIKNDDTIYLLSSQSTNHAVEIGPNTTIIGSKYAYFT